MMNHWTDRYVGREWSESYDCAALVADVLREECGREVVPPTLDWRRTPPDQVVDITKTMVDPVDRPAEFDAVLMRVRGNRRCLGSHIGVVGFVHGRIWTLHNVEKLGVLFTPEESTGRLQLEILGYYRFR